MSRLATLPVCSERLDFLVQVITEARENPTLINTFQGDQRPVCHHFVAVIELDLPNPLMCGNRRFQLFFIQNVFRLNVRHFRFR